MRVLDFPTPTTREEAMRAAAQMLAPAAGLTELKQIDFYDYRFLPGHGDNGARPQYGPTAQSVERVLPQLVLARDEHLRRGWRGHKRHERQSEARTEKMTLHENQPFPTRTV